MSSGIKGRIRLIAHIPEAIRDLKIPVYRCTGTGSLPVPVHGLHAVRLLLRYPCRIPGSYALGLVTSVYKNGGNSGKV